MGRRDITPDFYRFKEKGQELEGTYEGNDSVTIRGAEVLKHTIKRSSDGKNIQFLGGAKLDPMLRTIKQGDLVALVYQGEIEIASGNRVKDFKLYAVEPDTSKPLAKSK
jgi:hypothetical protein